MERVIIASQNAGKIDEIKKILSKYGMEVVSRNEAGIDEFEIDETGVTYEENSLLKAEAIFNISGQATIADDSGLSVDALGGEPGVYSARYAGEGCTYFDNNLKLLSALDGIPEDERTATFVTVTTMLFPDGTKLVARGECPGKITTEIRGERGFGYDPVFIPNGYDKTFAEMSLEDKNAISHRAKSLAKLEELIIERNRDKEKSK